MLVTALRQCAPCRPGVQRALAALLLASAGLLAGCAQTARDADAFGTWRASNAAEVTSLEVHLAQQGVAHVLPLHQLLRSASSWRDCGSEPFALPPPAQWPAVVSVLKLLRELQQRGVIGPIEVHSGFRAAELNRCAGGAARSAHLVHFAIDFTPADGSDPTAPLCAFWREHGRTWQMGFSRYPSGRIHVDTAGYRSWGSDHTGRSAVCAMMAP